MLEAARGGVGVTRGLIRGLMTLLVIDSVLSKSED
jgi:hypothetical protein